MLIMAGCFVLLMTSSLLAAEPFAVVELFASEGCSSCPPADDLLRKLIAQAQVKHQKVYVLSFQVDYWNYLGWKDPYSSKQFTGRQYQYANVLAGSRVYTPQMIINGQEAFIGSDEGKAKEAITRNLQHESVASLNLKVFKDDVGKVRVNYQISKLLDNTLINIALVERGLESHVTAGENEGRLLKHDNIVREFQTITLKEPEGEIQLSSFIDQIRKDRFSVIAYVQDASNMKVLAASEASI